MLRRARMRSCQPPQKVFVLCDINYVWSPEKVM